MSSLFVFACAWFVVVVSGTSAVRKGKMPRSTYRVLLGVMTVLTAAMLVLVYVRPEVRRGAWQHRAAGAAPVDSPARPDSAAP